MRRNQLEDTRRCPKCGGTMQSVPFSDWLLYDRASIDYICPECCHTVRVSYRVRHDGTLEECD